MRHSEKSQLFARFWYKKNCSKRWILGLVLWCTQILLLGQLSVTLLSVNHFVHDNSMKVDEMVVQLWLALWLITVLGSSPASSRHNEIRQEIFTNKHTKGSIRKQCEKFSNILTHLRNSSTWSLFSQLFTIPNWCKGPYYENIFWGTLWRVSSLSLSLVRSQRRRLRSPENSSSSSWSSPSRNAWITRPLLSVLKLTTSSFFRYSPEGWKNVENRAFLPSYDLAPPPSPMPFPVCNLDRRHTGRLRKRCNLPTGEGEGVGEEPNPTGARKPGPL